MDSFIFSHNVTTDIKNNQISKKVTMTGNIYISVELTVFDRPIIREIHPK